jgi:hypothetical protein
MNAFKEMLVAGNGRHEQFLQGLFPLPWVSALLSVSLLNIQTIQEYY